MKDGDRSISSIFGTSTTVQIHTMASNSQLSEEKFEI